ncbi:DegV family protein [Ligilactobacillus aviarius]|uniref:Fatty acid-binding protein DegV n=1 Tax=Ligilactobacillus aviarius TaxID=1606 RepID=A0A179CHP2_9LACO|nr:DegV family protein [Ligilactobacillus aviarius]OAP98178.1 fatty acid-binding protein DegV [Ligilactobacillus aviarius]OAP99226.1 fatty acid-binding protein DegV [Ligilactobacillus aviarius]OAQ00061.1 fatty acid-binding protein DegV [Ligilactobacillus aviarius]OAQ01897.1 fatty acid-binding protein DegV [Ligilactobacillus aviarius]OAQ02818.1 fatty acid-binding protein DegV [Ligilactobacillus aviarius]
MANIKIVTDSSVQLTPAEIKENNITIVPLTIEINGQTFVDGETITREELVEELKKGNKPKTSQPAVGSFVDVFDRLGEDGSQVVAILLSDVLSGTYQTAVSAAEMSSTDVTVINSKSTDRGEAFQVLAAAKDAAAGKTIAEIQAHCKDILERTTIDVLVDNLDNILSGGRLGKMASMLTKLINLKVIVRLRENSLDVVKKGRSRKTFFKYCAELKERHQDNPIQELSLSNVDCSDEYLEKVKDAVLPENSADAAYIARLTSPIIMTHTGLNAIGVITLAEKPEPDEYK